MLDGGAYWSRTTNPESDGGAYYLGWDDWGWYEYGGRLDGQCIRPVFNDETMTLISDKEGSYRSTLDSDNSIYDLTGRKIDNRKSANRKLPKGIYVKNGKKVAVK